MFVPNDPLYASLQWNLPMINLERAWDIQPQAGSSITVAVLDTGMAYQNATFTANLPAFRDEFGTTVSGARPRDDSVLGRAAAVAPPVRAASSRRATSSGTTTSRSISTATARTSAGRSVS